MKLWAEKIHLDLKVNWKLSRNQTTFKENFILHFETPFGHFRSEVAPNIRYGETVEKTLEVFHQWIKLFPELKINSIRDIELGLETVKLHSLRFALESLLISYLAARENQSLSSYLHLPPVKVVPTSFSMPILPIGEISDYLKPLGRFHSLKIKVDAESASEMLKEIKKYTHALLRIDANEGWKNLDEYLKFESSLKGMNIELIEQPFPSSMEVEYQELKKRTNYKILADESIEDVANFNELSKQFHAINIKLMKTGSLLKAIELINKARNHQMEVMMGCMIETTIGISYGMLFSGLVDYVDLDGFLLIKEEPFHLVKEDKGTLSLT